MKDIEIAKSVELQNIVKVAQKIGIEEEDLNLYGKYKAKIVSSRLSEKLKDKKMVNLF